MTDKEAQAVEDIMFERANSKRSIFTQQIKGSVWKTAISLLIVSAGYVALKDSIANNSTDRIVRESVKQEKQKINDRVAFHNSRMKGHDLSYIVMTEENGVYPYLVAKKDPENTWRIINESIEYTEDQIKWIEDYSGPVPGKKEFEEKYASFRVERDMLLSAYKKLLEENNDFAKFLRKFFAAWYAISPGMTKEKFNEIKKVCPAQLKDTYKFDELNEWIQRVNAAELAFKETVKSIKW